MKITSAEFITSSTDWRKCPETHKPEFAFIGRSNVGKSSLINMLVDRKKLAKTSSTPGKTQTVNHFLVNDQWYLVDLPGYGYASASQSARFEWGKMIEQYLKNRKNLFCTSVSPVKFSAREMARSSLFQTIRILRPFGRGRLANSRLRPRWKVAVSAIKFAQME